VLWGASVLPYTDSDLQGWPIRLSDLRPHYEDVLRMTGLSATRDSLEAQYPLLINPTTSLHASRQALGMLEQMTANARELESEGVFFGRARLAVGAPRGAASECTRCGLCLYGCPYGIIYSAQASLEKLLASSSKLRYVPGFVARKIIEKGERVLVEAVSRQSQGRVVFEASRVYVAAGVYSSTALLLDALEAQGRPITLRQSDHFLLPLLLKKRVAGVAEERLHTLSQIFMEVADPHISRHSVHLQVYTYNDYYSRMARSRLGLLFPVARPLVDRLVERLVLVKGYLHSEDSSAIQATLEPGGGALALRLRPLPNRGVERRVRSIVDVLKRHSHAIGASPLRLGLRLGAPGSGAHVGGSFPMRASRGDFETDLLGRCSSLDRVHVVDATVFPTVPAPTITLTAMANARRIASGSLDRETRT
jgi:choline dehydrogenase-like flavoprotein